MERTQSLGKLISHIHRKNMIYLENRLKNFEIHAGSVPFLIHISMDEHITLKTLSKSLMMDKTTTTKAVNKLVTAGFVIKKANPDDRRSHLLYLTNKGRKAIPSVRNILSDVSNRMGEGLRESEWDTLFKLLEKVSTNMTEPN